LIFESLIFPISTFFFNLFCGFVIFTGFLFQKRSRCSIVTACSTLEHFSHRSGSGITLPDLAAQSQLYQRSFRAIALIAGKMPALHLNPQNKSIFSPFFAIGGQLWEHKKTSNRHI
jgi:hypothetical protein